MKKRTRTVVVSVLAGGLGTLAGCAANEHVVDGEDPTKGQEVEEDGPVHNPPPPAEVIDEGQLPDAELPKWKGSEGSWNEVEWDIMRSLNGRHSDHGTIYRGRGTCYVHVPPPKGEEPQTSWQPPSTESVECSDEMAEFLWSQCYGGTISSSPDGSLCVCDQDGNPPPPPSYVHCPAESKPKAEDLQAIHSSEWRMICGVLQEPGVDLGELGPRLGAMGLTEPTMAILSSIDACTLPAAVKELTGHEWNCPQNALTQADCP